MNRLSLLSMALPLVVAGGLVPLCATPLTPSLAALPRFTAPDVPALGPTEVSTVPNWPVPTQLPRLPGDGLAQHPMLYAGEGYNVLLLVNQGRVIWKYQAGPGGEIDDVWLLSNGHILFTRQHSIEEVAPDKRLVWHWAAPAGTEVHTAQPLGTDRVAFVLNGLPPKVIVLNQRTGAVEVEFTVPAESATNPKTVHPQFRRMRVTAQGTFLLSFLRLGRVAEYDRTGRELWSYDIPTPWAATRLKNGNTLIVSERAGFVREVNPAKQTVWEVRKTDLPANLVIRNIQTAERLANGDTVLLCNTQGVKPAQRPTAVQAVEVAPDKRVVWVLQDWKDLGPATTAQFLDQPGIAEDPGDLQH